MEHNIIREEPERLAEKAPNTQHTFQHITTHHTTHNTHRNTHHNTHHNTSQHTTHNTHHNTSQHTSQHARCSVVSAGPETNAVPRTPPSYALCFPPRSGKLDEPIASSCLPCSRRSARPQAGRGWGGDEVLQFRSARAYTHTQTYTQKQRCKFVGTLFGPD